MSGCIVVTKEVGYMYISELSTHFFCFGTMPQPIVSNELYCHIRATFYAWKNIYTFAGFSFVDFIPNKRNLSVSETGARKQFRHFRHSWHRGEAWKTGIFYFCCNAHRSARLLPRKTNFRFPFPFAADNQSLPFPFSACSKQSEVAFFRLVCFLFGDLETWRHGDGDMESDMDTETCKAK